MSKQIPNLQLEQIKEMFLRTHGDVYKNEIIDHLKMNDPFYFLRGTKAESAITVKQSIDSTELVIPKLNYENLQPYFRGTDTTNKGVAPTVDSMNVKQSFVKLKMMAYDHRYVKPQLGMDFISQMYANLKNGIAQMHTSQVYNQFAKCFAQNALYYANKPNVNELKTDEFYYTNYIIEGAIPFQQNVPAYIPACGVDIPNPAGDVVSFDRCVFGADKLLVTVPIGGDEPTIATQINNALFGDTATANINTPTSSILTVSHLQHMIELARIGSRIAGTEDSVYPLITTSFNNTPAMGYVIFISRDAFEGLRRTTEYQNQINRAFREVAGQPSLYNGSNFVMQIGNTDVYVSDLLSQMQFTTAAPDVAAAKINYSVLMGKQAIVQIDSPIMDIADWKTETNYNQDTFEIFYDEMTGYKPIRFRAKNINKPNSLVDRGLVHSFTLSPQSLRV